MRGPNVRLQNDVRRLWRCPECGYQRHVPQTEVTVRCHCSKSEPLMKLVESQRKARVVQEALPTYFEFEELLNDEPDSNSKGTSSTSSSTAVTDDASEQKQSNAQEHESATPEGSLQETNPSNLDPSAIESAGDQNADGDEHANL